MPSVPRVAYFGSCRIAVPLQQLQQRGLIDLADTSDCRRPNRSPTPRHPGVMGSVQLLKMSNDEVMADLHRTREALYNVLEAAAGILPDTSFCRRTAA